MTVYNLQTFIFQYIRNKNIRKTYKFTNNKEKFLQDFGLTLTEIKLANEIDINLLDKTSNELEERLRKNIIGLYTDFFNILDKLNYSSTLLDEFLLENPKYLNTEELVNTFYSFTLEYSKKYRLPEFLIQLLTYSYTLLAISLSTSEMHKNTVDFNPNKPLVLKRPYKTISLNYDFDINFSANITVEELSKVNKIADYKLFIQKNYNAPNECIIFELEDDEKIFNLLQKNLSLNQILLQAQDSYERENWETLIRDLYNTEVIGFQD